MSVTPISLLDRLRAQPDPATWERFHTLYRPLIQSWLSRVPGLRSDNDDMTQDVLAVIVREIGQFDRQREGSFRAWLRLVCVNRVRKYRRDQARRPATGADPADDFLARLADPASDLSAQWDRDHDRHVFDKLLAAVQPDFEPTTWEAFRRYAVDGQPAARVAAELGLSENAVMLAKSRILKRLRDEATGLID